MHGFVTTIVIIGLLLSVVGLVIPLGIFAKKRLVALAVLIALGTGGIALSNSLRSPEQVKADEVADARSAENNAAGYSAVEADPENFIRVETTYEANGSLMVSGTLTNTSNFGIMNVRLRCDQFGQTGKRLERESITIAQEVPAGGSTQFGPLAVGYADQQLTSILCQATDGEIVHAGAEAAPA